jgi:phospholipid transport system transporter-binding protein
MTGNGDREPAADGGARFVPDAAGASWTFEGDLTFANAGVVYEATRDVPLPATGVVDCRGVGAVDSAAIAVLLELQRRAAGERRSLVFTNLPASLRALGELYGVAEILVPA